MCLFACYFGRVKYAGLDIHDQSVVVCIVDAAGCRLHSAIVPTARAEILRALRAVRGPIAVAFEEGTLANWLRSALRGQVRAITVCDPRRNRLLLSGSKSDRLDAARLAELLRLGALHPVYHGDEALERLRTLAHHYDAVTRDLVRVKLRLRAVFRSRAIPTGGDGFFNARHRRRYLKQLKRRPAETFRAEALFQQLDWLVELKAGAQAALVTEAAQSGAFKILQSFPYVGPVRAALFLAMVGSPDRFRNRRRFWRYAGYGVRRVASGEHAVTAGEVRRLPNKARTCGLDRRCNYVLKRVLREIATSAASGRGPLRKVYDRATGRGLAPGVARAALARRIAATLLALWRSMKPYDPSFPTPSLRPVEASVDPFLASS